MQIRKLSTTTASLMSKAILNSQTLSDGPMPTLDPFLFCVYHKDQYPAGNSNMEAPYEGNGSDFDPEAPYRMYHGERIPGFPSHPHRGFETLTATIEGIIDHADSLGNAGRYGDGDLQWMTAGKGCVHSEMFPLIRTTQDNPTRFFQIWLNLPSKNKMAEPGFKMFWNHQIPIYQSSDENIKITLWAGNDLLPDGMETNNAPPASSWAADETNQVAIWHITMQPGATWTLPAATNADVNRQLFYLEGDSQVMTLDGQGIQKRTVHQLQPDVEVELQLDETAQGAGEFLLLQGKPISEPVAQYGPFVMNTAQEVQQAFTDYSKTRFGGWPWPRDDMVFDREQGRFAQFGSDKDKETPSNAACLAD